MMLDGIHRRMLREMMRVIAKLLSTMYQHFWSMREAPEDWRLASVSLIYKKDCKEDPGNNRPVSLTLVPGKIILSEIPQHRLDSQEIRLASMNS